MDAMMLLGEVERPVGVEVPVVLWGAESQDGLGALDAPPGAGDVETIADQVPAGAFHDPCRDRPARGQRHVVAQVLLLVHQVAHACVDASSLAVCQLVLAGLWARDPATCPAA